MTSLVTLSYNCISFSLLPQTEFLEHRSTIISATSVDITVASRCLIHRNSKVHFKNVTYFLLWRFVCFWWVFLGCCNKSPAPHRGLMTYYILTTHLGGTCIPHLRVSMVAQWLKNLPAMQETWVQSLGWEDPLGEEMATHSSILAWRIPWAEEPTMSYSPWGHKESDTTEQLTLSLPNKI